MLRGTEADGTSEEHPLLSFMGTASVARDMNAIPQMLWEAKLKYWGFSSEVSRRRICGLVSGKVERMVRDGNVDFEGG